MNYILLLIGLLKIFIGGFIIFRTLFILIELSLEKIESPSEWEERMKKIFCEKEDT